MILYLSCTGNTLWAAKQLAETINDRLTKITDVMDSPYTLHLKEGERIGFCLPVHGWRVQPIVRKFIEDMEIILPQNSDGTSHERLMQRIYTYFLLTCGDSCGEYADELENVLISKGLEVSTCCSVIMPESYVGLPFMDVDRPLREAEKKLQARGTVMRFADILVDHRSVRMPIERGAMPHLYSRVFGRIFYSWLITDKRFHVMKDRCIGCGKCVKHCPVSNMAMSDSTEEGNRRHPVWLHTGRCLTCMACYHYCPEHAIGFWHFTKNKGQYFFDHNKTTVCK